MTVSPTAKQAKHRAGTCRVQISNVAVAEAEPDGPQRNRSRHRDIVEPLKHDVMRKCRSRDWPEGLQPSTYFPLPQWITKAGAGA